MKLEFDVKVTEKDLYSFNIEQASPRADITDTHHMSFI
jgi:hypothetical protein